MIPKLNDLNKDINFEEFLVKCNISNLQSALKLKETVRNLPTLIDLVEEHKLYEVLTEKKSISDSIINSININFKDVDFILLLDELSNENYELFNSQIYTAEEICPTIIFNSDNFEFLKDFKDVSFCITGTLDRPRRDFEKFIVSNKGVFQTSVTNSTKILIYSTSDGMNTTKYKKACKLRDAGKNIKIITETEFWNYVKF